MTKTVIAMLAVGFGLVACGGGDNGGSKSPVVEPSPPIVDSSLIGIWLSGCHLPDEPHNSERPYETISLEFTSDTSGGHSGQWLVEGETFDNDSCARTAGQVQNYSRSSPYRVYGTAVTTTSGVQAMEIDLGAEELSPIIYSLYQVEDNRLLMGDFATGRGDSPENRPRDLASEPAYIKEE